MRTVQKHPVRTKAFTLLELILVMIIMCSILAMAAPSLRGFFTSNRLKDLSERILAMTRYAKVQSIFESNEYRVNFDMYRRRFWISSSSENQQERLANNFGNYYLIPEEIEISFDNLPSEKGIYYFQFNPRGYSRQAAIRLEDNRENILEIICRSPAENYEIVKIVDGREYDL